MNSHVIAFYNRAYFQMEEQGRYWAMALIGEIHNQELELAMQQTDEQTTLVNRITDLAVTICARAIGIVHVEYNGAANQLHVRAKSPTGSGLDEYVDLAYPSDSELAKRRARNQLREIIRALEAFSLRPIPGAPLAA